MSSIPSPINNEQQLSPPPGNSPWPLGGKTILVTRSAGQSREFSNLLEKAGARVIEMPALEICPPSSWEALDRAIAELSKFDWLILTSSNAVDYFFERLGTQLMDIRCLTSLKIAVVGKKTAQSLTQLGVQPDFIPPDFIADSLAANFPEPLEGKKILFPRVETGGRDLLLKEFVAQGAEVVEVPAYESCCPDAIAPEVLEALQGKSVDIITFASSKTVRNFWQLVETSLPPDWIKGVCIASIGPQTSESCKQLLGRVDIEAQQYTLEGLIEAIIQIGSENFG